MYGSEQRLRELVDQAKATIAPMIQEVKNIGLSHVFSASKQGELSKDQQSEILSVIEDLTGNPEKLDPSKIQRATELMNKLNGK